MATETFDLSNPDKPTIPKDAQAVLDYTWNWTEWLDLIADTILSHTVTPVAPAFGVVKDSSTPDVTNKKITAVLSGGTAQKKVQVTCHIVTVGGRTDDRSIYLKIRER